MRILLLTPLLLIGCGTAPWIDNSVPEEPYMVEHRKEMARMAAGDAEIDARTIETLKLACAKHQPEQEFPCDLAKKFPMFSGPTPRSEITYRADRFSTITTPQGSYGVMRGGGRTYIYKH